MILFSLIANKRSENPLDQKFQKRRFELFNSLLDSLEERPMNILDIGGSVNYWNSMNFKRNDCEITLLTPDVVEVKEPVFRSIKGDPTDLSQFADRQFDVVFSSSAIEHLYTFKQQRKMAREVERVGRNYFIQSPNFWFPIEPYWFFPFFHFFPKWLRIEMTHKFDLGLIGRMPTRVKAIDKVEEVRLLTKTELKRLFPNSRILPERYFGMDKSYILYSFGVF